MFTDVPEIAAAQVTALAALTAIAFSFALAFAIAFIYRKTHRGFSYSPSFVFTLILVAILSAVVMLVVENSLARAFAILGTFTIIRYRTAIKDTRDTAFLLWAIVTGLAVGTTNYALALVATGLVGIVVLALSKFDFGSLNKPETLLYFTTKAEPETYTPLFEQYCTAHHMLSVRASGGTRSLTYSITPLNEREAHALVRALQNAPQTDNIELVSTKEDIE
ncbi:MAG: DUF4956 domain-containing protein [bacterium]|nr:DUF4956 domain-containing protein [bacterium]MDZ4285001.1 DUF4956 domain-containing protein [Patescibacteria group bacterium]